MADKEEYEAEVDDLSVNVYYEVSVKAVNGLIEGKTLSIPMIFEVERKFELLGWKVTLSSRQHSTVPTLDDFNVIISPSKTTADVTVTPNSTSVEVTKVVLLVEEIVSEADC